MELKPLDYNITIGDLGCDLDTWGNYFIVQINEIGWLSGEIGSCSMTGPNTKNTIESTKQYKMISSLGRTSIFCIQLHVYANISV